MNKYSCYSTIDLLQEARKRLKGKGKRKINSLSLFPLPLLDKQHLLLAIFSLLWLNVVVLSIIDAVDSILFGKRIKN
ncbi:MAG: hypothetical protein RMX35_13610 [Nostoc sp. DcaGUA01]|nr:hypothetical protein [Nostoc sp. SerVER01]MDZ8080094.1 hypothetical protein [Nostoc sp. DcaGUA01]